MRKILIIDDEPDIRALLSEFLICAGYQVLEAEDGKKGIELVLKEFRHVGLIITDIAMPVMNGIELERQIHRLIPDIKMIALTGSVNVHEDLNTLESKFDMVIQKPFDLRELEKQIAHFVPA